MKEDGTNAHESRTVKSVASIQFLGQERERHRGGAANDSRKQMKRPQQPAVALAPLAVILSLRFLSYFPSFFLNVWCTSPIFAYSIDCLNCDAGNTRALRFSAFCWLFSSCLLSFVQISDYQSTRLLFLYYISSFLSSLICVLMGDQCS